MSGATRKTSVLLAFVALTACASGPTLLTFAPEELRVRDGDSLQVIAGPMKGERIRLRKLNAPEWDEPGGPEATSALNHWVKSHDGPIQCRQYTRDKWARIIAECK